MALSSKDRMRVWRKAHPGEQRWQTARRKLLDKLKEDPCTDCHLTFPVYVMDWDHVRGEKVRAISDMRKRNVPLEQILEEIEKCDLVCANCHRIRTYDRQPKRLST